MSLLAKFRTKYGEDIGVELFFSFPELQGDPMTYLDTDSSVGAISLTVANGSDFSANQYIVIGQAGGEKSELIQISGATSTTLTLSTTTSFAHNRGDAVFFIPFNQIVPERSTDSGTTYSALSALNIRADASETYLQRTSDASTNYYRFRFYNSQSTLYSAYSDAVIASGYGDNTIWAVKNRALNQLGETRSILINDQFMNDVIMEARRIADQNPAVLRWSFRTKFGQVLGQMLAGQWSINAPTDLRDRNSYKNILSLRMANQNRPMLYQDRRRFNQNYLNIVHSTVATAYVSGGTSLVLASTHDLDSSGSITVANNSVGDGYISITYSANNKNTNTLTITAASRNIAVGTDIWQRGIAGLPTAFTIDNGKIYFDVLLKTDYDGQDVKIDYYQAIQVIDSDADTFDEPFYDLYVSYLKFRIKYLKANGKIDRDSDTDWKDWQNGIATLLGQEVGGQKVDFVPDVEGFLSAVE